MDTLPSVPNWPPLDTLMRLTLALTCGLFIGLEREWRGKEAGLRTFGFTCLLGGLGAMMGTPFALLVLGICSILIVFLNIPSIRGGQGAELTTSAALLVTCMTGVLCGRGLTITPVAVAVTSAGLLAWKERLAGLSHKLSAKELRSAILLAILAFAIYPVLPGTAIDPWGLIVPRAVWVTVILIAAIGFVNYMLWKAFGARGIHITGFLGGLVNSTVTVTEMSARYRDAGPLTIDVVYRGILLATTAMALRNGVLLGLLEPFSLIGALPPLVVILLISGGLAFAKRPPELTEAQAPELPLESPFSLSSAVRYALLFLILQVASTVAKRLLGHLGFYAVSIIGGLVSSASSVASAATLAAQGQISPATAGVGSVLASLASAAVNVVLVWRVSGNKALSQRVCLGMVLIVIGGVAIAPFAPTIMELTERFKQMHYGN